MEFTTNAMNKIQIISLLIESGKSLSLISFVHNLRLELFSLKNNEASLSRVCGAEIITLSTKHGYYY
jgi:hypothetical protein